MNSASANKNHIPDYERLFMEAEENKKSGANAWISNKKFWCEQSTSPAVAVSPRNPAGSRPFATNKKHPFGC